MVIGGCPSAAKNAGTARASSRLNRLPDSACIKLPTLAVTTGWRMLAYIVVPIRRPGAICIAAALMTTGSFTA